MGMVNVSSLGFGGTGIPDTLPQAVAELQGQKVSVVAGAAANTLIVVPGMDPEDTIGSIVDLTTPATVDPTTCTIQGRNASATITALTTAADGDKVTVNGKPYTVKDVIVSTSYNAPPGVVAVDITPSGNNANDLAKALSTAIMSGDSTLTCSVSGAIVTVKVRQPGTAGNAVTLTETGNAFTVSGATFAGGVAAGSAGFKSTVSTAGKNLLVFWYDKHPGVATAPLMARFGDDEEGPVARAMRHRGPGDTGIGSGGPGGPSVGGPGGPTVGGPVGGRPSAGLPGTPGVPSHQPAPGGPGPATPAHGGGPAIPGVDVPGHTVAQPGGSIGQEADMSHGFNVGSEIHEKAPNKK